MKIESGTRFGPYEIVAPIGAGGMGEVWRAIDPRIGREVAIKILHPSMADNEDLVRRFEQEARTVGQLNHPNLIAVHDVGEEGDVAYLVTELLEGDTLRERMSGGALPARRAVEWASGIASGLAAAHDKGVVHRDLKPENIFITKDNRVKILDFGLARLTNAGLPDSGNTDAPTAHRTDPGKVMGTVGYMSPEQVRAKSLDHRSDIFSFGAVLYEMVSGVRAFRRDSSVETMNAILKEEPPDLSSTSPNVHPGLERIIRHCLEKHPEARFQSAKDLAFDLESLSGSASSSYVTSGVRDRRSRLLPVALVLGAMALAIVAYMAGARSDGRVGSDRDTERLTQFERLTFRRGNVLHGRLTPDGQSVVFSAAWDGQPAELFVARVDDGISRPLGIERADVLDVSSRGEIAILLKDRLVLATAGLGTLARVPLGGGVPREIMESVASASWSPDGEELAVIRYDSAAISWVLEYPIGTELYRSKSLMRYPEVSPDGETVVFTEETDEASVRLVSRDGTLRTLTTLGVQLAPLRWVTSDRLIYTRGTDTTVLLDLDGNERIVAEMPGLELHDIEAGGTALYEREIYRLSIAYGETGLPDERDLGWMAGAVVPALSDDGKLLFTEVGPNAGGGETLFVRNVDGSPPVMLGEGFGFDISGDGRWVLAGTRGEPNVVSLIPTGPGMRKEIRIEDATLLRFALFIDQDRRVLIMEEHPDGARFHVYDLESATSRPITIEDAAGGGALSADGERIAYRRNDGQVVVRALEGGQAEVVPGALEGDDPIQWSVDGRTLWVREKAGVPQRVSTIDLVSGERAIWKDLAPKDRTGLIRIDEVVIAPDGESWAYAYTLVTDSDLFTARLTGVEGLEASSKVQLQSSD